MRWGREGALLPFSIVCTARGTSLTRSRRHQGRSVAATCRPTAQEIIGLAAQNSPVVDGQVSCSDHRSDAIEYQFHSTAVCDRLAGSCLSTYLLTYLLTYSPLLYRGILYRCANSNSSSTTSTTPRRAMTTERRRESLAAAMTASRCVWLLLPPTAQTPHAERSSGPDERTCIG